jgi:hypothetical protein
MHRFFAVTAQMLQLSDFLQETFYDNHIDEPIRKGTVNENKNVLVVEKAFLVDYITRNITSVMSDVELEKNRKAWENVQQMMGTVQLLSVDLIKAAACTADVIMFDDDKTFSPARLPIRRS